MSCDQNTNLAESISENEKLSLVQKRQMIREIINEDYEEQELDDIERAGNRVAWV